MSSVGDEDGFLARHQVLSSASVGRREGSALQRQAGKCQTSQTCRNVARGTHQETLSEHAYYQKLNSVIKACQ